MLTLYHGSTTIVEQPFVMVGRLNLDFGRGFYLTKYKEQAEVWAKIVASRKKYDATAILNAYQFDLESAISYGFRYKSFDEYNIEWLNYVVDCRQGKDYSDIYDIVSGGVANDNVIDTIEDYEKGIITAEQALGQLRYKKVNHQICIMNQEVIAHYLSFKESQKLDIEI